MLNSTSRRRRQHSDGGRLSRLAASSMIAAASMAWAHLPIPASAQLPALEPLGVVGCDFCDGPEQFANIRALALDGTGRLWVADGASPQIRLFDGDGVPVRTFGRTGDGPGEVRLTVGLRATDGGVAALDMRLLRVTRYDSLGEVLSTTRLERFPLGARSHHRAGTFIIPFADWRNNAAGVARLAGDTGVVVLEPPVDFLVRDDGSSSFTFVVGAAPDGGFVIGDGTDDYAIRRYAADGSVRFEYARNLERVARTPTEVAEMEERLQRAAARMGRNNPEADGFRPTVDPLRRHFGADALQFDDAGRLWVRTERGGLDATVFDLFAPGGAFLGELRVPARLRDFTLRADRLAAVVTDELGIQRIGVWRVLD